MNSRLVSSFSGILLFCVSLAIGQSDGPFYKVDTLTAGPFNDLHPRSQNGWSGAGTGLNDWIVFERQSDSLAMIAAMRRPRSSHAWDTLVEIVSSSPASETQALPQIVFSNHPPCLIGVWQKRTDGKWGIWYSWQKGDTTVWSDPARVTRDSVDCTSPHGANWEDTASLITWRRGKAILGTFLSQSSLGSPESAAPPETLAVSNDDSLEYDLGFSIGTAGIVWTVKDSSGGRLLLTRQINSYPFFSLSVPETLAARGSVLNPRVASPYYSAYGPYFYERLVGGRHEVHFASTASDELISSDSSVDFRNPVVFESPVVTAGTASAEDAGIFWYGSYVVEAYRHGDSTLFFQEDDQPIDTVRSAGHNRDACFGSMIFYDPLYHQTVIPIVWESNRSGRCHLYTRMAAVPLGLVKQENSVAKDFGLDQNFPNPFNPSTSFRFHIGHPAEVSIAIFDILGRMVKTLIAQRLGAGDYTVTWNAGTRSSGIYFCRMRAGDYTEIRKLLLVK
ncbi:MAG TPA: T9SS type A sorting domain-containing protein [Bacteroidota bacterium]|nr:T9SS type A sorting domain-containing protein [Bacteroidota bacterium]